MMAQVSGEISEKIIRTKYFVHAKSWFVIFNNKFCPQPNAVEFSDRFLKKKKDIANPRIKNIAPVNSYWTSRFLSGIATEEMKNLVSL